MGIWFQKLVRYLRFCWTPPSCVSCSRRDRGLSVLENTHKVRFIQTLRHRLKHPALIPRQHYRQSLLTHGIRKLSEIELRI